MTSAITKPSTQSALDNTLAHSNSSSIPLNNIAVVGLGQMGGGIAQVLAHAGYSVLVYDLVPQGCERGLAEIKKRLDRLIEKQTLDVSTRDKVLGRLKSIKSLEEISSANLVIEAIVENPEIKLQFFKNLDGICKPDSIFATNTSSISITKIAASTKRPEKVIGMHFMNPVPVMKLVEIIRGLQTSEQTFQTIYDLTVKLEKTPVVSQRDFPGFIVNRILVPMINEAMFVLMEGIASPEDIDNAMKLGTNQPMGPLALADFVGLDTVLAIARILHNELGDDKYRPCPLLVKYVEAGWLGKKSGRGFYRYTS